MLALQIDVENTLHFTFTNQPEPVITYLLEGASQAIKTYVNRELEEATYTNELHDSVWGRTLLRLREYPVSAVSAVEENSVALVEGESFQWYPDGRVARINGTRPNRWQVGRKIIDVSYTAGYAVADIPTDIRNVCAGIAARHFKAGADYAATPNATGTITQVTLEGSDAISYAEPPDAQVGYVPMLTVDDMSALSRYRRRLVL